MNDPARAVVAGPPIGTVVHWAKYPSLGCGPYCRPAIVVLDGLPGHVDLAVWQWVRSRWSRAIYSRFRVRYGGWLYRLAGRSGRWRWVAVEAVGQYDGPLDGVAGAPPAWHPIPEEAR